MSRFVGNPEDRFCRDAAHIVFGVDSISICVVVGMELSCMQDIS